MQSKYEQTLPKTFIYHLKHAKLMIQILNMDNVIAFHNKTKYYMEADTYRKINELKV